jgi:hypothetical protein
MHTHLIYLFINNRQQGPYALDQIRRMWNSGSITADTLYWHEGMVDWGSVHELVTQQQTASTPPPLPIQTAPRIVKAQYNQASDSFTATMPLMMKLAMKAIQELGWKLDNANEAMGLVTFQTLASWWCHNGVQASLNIEEISNNTYTVSGTGKQIVPGGQIWSIELGNAKTQVQKTIDKMKELAR